MSVESAKAFLKKISEDEEFKKKVAEAKDDREKVKQLLSEAGFDFTKEELEEAVKATGSEELSDADLDKVAGGSTSAWIGVAIGIGAAL